MKNLRTNFGLVFRLLKKSVMAWLDDNALRLSASLSYCSVFSIAPLLLISIGIVGWFMKDDAASGKVAIQLSNFIGWEAAKSVQTMVESASQSSGKASVLGFGLLLFGASSVFGELKSSLNAIWGVRQKPGLGVWGFVRERLASFGMVLVIGLLLLVSLALTTFLAGMNGWLEVHLHLPKIVSAIFGFLLPLGVEVALFALIFQVLPDAKIRWRCVGLGALVTALLFEIGKTGLAWYLGRASTTSSFGAAGSLVVLLVWVYYASAILFLGAEFTKVYAAEAKAWIEPSDVAERVPTVEGLAGQAPIKVGVQPHPLHPNDPVPALPMKESLAALVAAPLLATQVLAPPGRPLRARQLPRTRMESWLEVAREHPEAQLAAALGAGLLAGTISRLFEKKAPALTAAEHFAEGSRKTAASGRSLAAAGVAWTARHLTKTALRHYGEQAREKGAHWSHVVAERVAKAMA